VTALVFVHGFMGGSAQWKLQAPMAGQRELICVDLPGFGRNAHLPPIDRIEEFAKWVLDDLTRRGVKQFDLLGHSMGGMIVQEMMHRAPERVLKFILYGTGAIGVLPGRFEPIETSMQRAGVDGPKATARRIAATWFLKQKAAVEYPACAELAEETSAPALIAGLEAMRGWNGLDRLSEIAAPTLVLWGDRDRTYPWSQIERLWQSIPNCNLAVVPACAHAVHLERPRLFNELISTFLDYD
jgi:2-hydroxy-6-oxonona-2,4-dienedioate hydrolase